jgi:hypothetical protein
LNIVLPGVALVHVEALKIFGDVIRCPGVHQPWRETVVGGRGGGVSRAPTVVVADKVLVEVVLAIKRVMPPISAELALRTLLLATAGGLLLITTVAIATRLLLVGTALALLVGVPRGAPPSD